MASNDKRAPDDDEPSPTQRFRRDAAPAPSPASPWTARPAPRDVAADDLTRDTERISAEPLGSTGSRATLTVMTGLHAGQVFVLAVHNLIGRSHKANLHLDDPGVSAKHVSITRIGGRFALEDLDSTNGTFVDGQQVKTAELVAGSRVQLGPNILLRFGMSDETEEALQRRLFETSTRDSLTGAFNRMHFEERVVTEVAYSRRHRSPLALLMMDLDRFKQLNDMHGHLAGDAALREIARCIQAMLRMEDLLARYGGEEFVVLARATDSIQAARLAERLRGGVEALDIAIAGGTVRTTLTIGVAGMAEIEAGGGATQLLALADARMYRAKKAGRNRVCSEG